MSNSVGVWQCKLCNQWNDMGRISCACGGSQATDVRAYQFHPKPSVEEQQFYAGTMPAIARSLREISEALRALIREVQELKGEDQT